MGTLAAVGAVVLWGYLVYRAALDRYHREFPPEDPPPSWVREWLDEWDDL